MPSGITERERALRDEMATRWDRMQAANEKVSRHGGDPSKALSKEERDGFAADNARIKDIESELANIANGGGFGSASTRGIVDGATVHRVNAATARESYGRRHLIGKDTFDLPDWIPPGDTRAQQPLEARHDLTAFMSQMPGWNPRGTDWGSFDRNAFYRQMATRNYEGREFRALSEGSQSVSVTGAGVTVPIEFSSRILELLRANLVFTSEGADGTINGPQVWPMISQTQVIPTWSADAVNVGAYLTENTQLAPGTASLGNVFAQAMTAASVQLVSRQAIEDSILDLGEQVELNTARAIARTMDQSALYGTGHAAGQPAGILTGAYSGLNVVSMGTNGAALSATYSAAGAAGMYGPFMKAIQVCRAANEDGPLACFTNPEVQLYADSGLSTLNTYIEPPPMMREIWPPNVSTAFSQTEVQGSSSAASSALVLNPNRILLPMRVGLTFMRLDERYADFLQYGFVAYVRHDWQFPYAAAETRIEGILV